MVEEKRKAEGGKPKAESGELRAEGEEPGADSGKMGRTGFFLESAGSVPAAGRFGYRHGSVFGEKRKAYKAKSEKRKA